jgi:hypothetical protein
MTLFPLLIFIYIVVYNIFALNHTMIGNRAIFIFVSLLLAMVMIVSTVPIQKDEETTDKPTEKYMEEETTTLHEIHETSTIPQIVTDNLLFVEVIVVPLDKNIIKDNTLLFKEEGKVPVTSTSAVTQSFKN